MTAPTIIFATSAIAALVFAMWRISAWVDEQDADCVPSEMWDTQDHRI